VPIKEDAVSDTISTPAVCDYEGLGYVANPFPPIDESATEPLWMRLAVHAAANAMLSGVMRASDRDPPGTIAVLISDEIPDQYNRGAQNDFLKRTAHDEALSMMALNVPLEMMRLGRIRGTLAEVAELAAAVDLSVTLGAYFVDALATPDTSLKEWAATSPEAVARAAEAFTDDPRTAVERFFGAPASSASMPSMDQEDDALREVYVRQVALDADPDIDSEAVETDPAPVETDAAEAAEPTDAEQGADSSDTAVVHADDAVRDYLLALVRADLSPVIARALAAYRAWGDTIIAQELKVTKAPRKTLAAILRLMSYRWKRIVVLYDRFDAWPMLEQRSRMDVLAALTELRWIVGEHGVMGVVVTKGRSIEVEEQFAGGERIEWSMPELGSLYNGEFAFDPEKVQRWLDAAALSGVSAVKADGPELADLVAACGDDIRYFALMAEAAFRNAAERGSALLDRESVAAALASVTIGGDVG
jgi:hypothetical protein